MAANLGHVTDSGYSRYMAKTQPMLDRSDTVPPKRIDLGSPKRPLPRTRNSARSGCGFRCLMLFLIVVAAVFIYYWT